MSNAPMSTTESSGRFLEPVRVARMAILIALSVVGALIKIPSPTGTVALDAVPAYFAALAFHPLEGGIIGAIGHIITAMTTGFPLGVPLHLLVAAEMVVFVWVFGYLARRVNVIVAAVVAVILNGFVGALLTIPIAGTGLFAALVLPLTVTTIITVILAIAGAKAVRAAGLGTE